MGNSENGVFCRTRGYLMIINKKQLISSMGYIVSLQRY